MKVLYSKSSDRVNLTVKVTEDHLKLYIDAELVPPKPATPPPSPTNGAEAKAAEAKTGEVQQQGQQPGPAAVAPAVPPSIEEKPITRAEILPLFEPVFNPRDMDQRVLDDVALCLNRRAKVVDRRVRKGEAAEAGLDGRFLLLVRKFTGKSEIVTSDDQNGSFMERHLFDNIIIGQIVARVYPPKPGKEGVDVFGAPIPPPQSNGVKIAFDKSLKIEKHPPHDYEVLVALTEGFLVEDNGTFIIREELTLSGDLDLRLGNIECIGRVKVSGSVASGIALRAKKGIEVGEGMQESILESTHGDIVVRGFAFGGKRGRIIGGKEVKVGIAQELRVEAVQDIAVEKEAIDCIFRTQTQVRMPTGKFIGGEAFVVCGMEAKELGNEVGKLTLVHLCSDIETSTDYSTLLGQLAAHDQALKLVEVHLGPYARNPDRIQLLKSPFKDRMEKLREKRDEIVLSRGKLHLRQKELLSNARRSGTLRVSCHGMIHQGVVITAGDKRLEVQEAIKGPKTIEFNPADESFVVKAFEPVVCAVKFNEGVNNDQSQ
jgi:uncharacterized protein (DUF342 family)